MLVEYAELFVHHKNNKVVAFNCKVAEGLNLSVVPMISESQALDSALHYLGGSNLYSWQDSTYEAELKSALSDVTATSFPKGELLICKRNIDKNYAASEFSLAYKFSICSLSPYFSFTVYIDANTGEFIRLLSNSQSGNAELLYGYGNKYIDTEWRGGIHQNHRLFTNDIQNRIIVTKVSKGMENPGGPNYNNSTDVDDVWDRGQAALTTAHWCSSLTWDYYKVKFNREGFGQTTPTRLNILVSDPNHRSNAAYKYEYNCLYFGSMPDGSPYIAKDVVGHEYTHGITAWSAGLIYGNEPGALNESFSDIFGYETERFMNGGTHTNWINADDIPGAKIRIFNNPHLSTPTLVDSGTKLQSQPAFYGKEDSLNWYTGKDDWGGVHFNSGVQNFWFYLLSDGSLNSPQPTYNSINVFGIGEDKASQIAFYNLDNFLGQNSSYYDSRIGSILAANMIFGACSNEAKQTRNAWAAVGLGAPFQSASISGPSYIYYLGSAGGVLGNMPKIYTAVGDIRPNSWTYSGPWSTGVLMNKYFLISDFNYAYKSAVIQVNNPCECISKKINFINVYGDGPGGGSGSSTMKLFPNPAHDEIQISIDFGDFNNTDDVIISIFDALGDLKFQETFENIPEKINIETLVPGSYILVAHRGSSVQQIKFIKE